MADISAKTGESVFVGNVDVETVKSVNKHVHTYARTYVHFHMYADVTVR